MKTDIELRKAIFDIIGDFVSMRNVQIDRRGHAIYVRMPAGTPWNVKRDLKQTWKAERAGAGFADIDLIIVDR